MERTFVGFRAIDVVQSPCFVPLIGCFPASLLERKQNTTDLNFPLASRIRMLIQPIMVPLRSEHPPSLTMSSWTPGRRKFNAPFLPRLKITPFSDLWVTDSSCTANCNGITTFNPSQSSSFANLTTPFSIRYGSGNAQGTLGRDVVQLAGFSVPNQVFGNFLSPSTPKDHRRDDSPFHFQLSVIPSPVVSSSPQSPV